jgi:isopenicillin N synthase-like dioxygenase
MNAVISLGHILMSHVARSLDLSPSYFHDRYTADPLILFRIFQVCSVSFFSCTAEIAEAQYPSRAAPDSVKWGVGEHTDYVRHFTRMHVCARVTCSDRVC